MYNRKCIIRQRSCQAEMPLVWQTFWRHDVFLTSMRTFWSHDMFLTSWQTFFYIFLTSWRVFDVMRCLWLHDKLFNMTSWRFLTFWHHVVGCTYWRHSERYDVMELFDDMMYFFYVLTHLFTSRLTFWRHGLFYFMTNLLSAWRIFIINSGTKYNENVISI